MLFCTGRVCKLALDDTLNSVHPNTLFWSGYDEKIAIFSVPVTEHSGPFGTDGKLRIEGWVEQIEQSRIE